MDPLIVECTRKGGGRYVQTLLPTGVKEGVIEGALSLEGIIAALFYTAEVAGYGGFELLGYSYNTGAGPAVEDHAGDFVTMHVTDPYSIAPVAGVICGAVEDVTGLPVNVDYAEVEPGTYEIKATVGEHAIESEERLEQPEYHYEGGDIELVPCPGCGLPKALSAFEWDGEKGIITDTRRGRRMVAIGPYVMDPLFKELEEELGEAIPRAVVESQRRFVKTGFYSVDEVRDVEGFRLHVALKGMGNLRELKMSPLGLRMTIDHAGCYLMMVGLMQGIFEMAYDMDSKVEWEFSQEDHLEVQVTRKK
jgi:hypothetical protein